MKDLLLKVLDGGAPLAAVTVGGKDVVVANVERDGAVLAQVVNVLVDEGERARRLLAGADEDRPRVPAVAVEVAETNVRLNGLEGRVICLEAAGFDNDALHEAAPFDLVFANILKGPLIALAPDMAAHLAPGGFAILSGILNEQAENVIEVYARNGFNLVDHQSIVDWSTLTLQRM